MRDGIFWNIYQPKNGFLMGTFKEEMSDDVSGKVN
jgi:hypothetical protein